MKKKYANATAKTKISFEYEVRPEEDLKFMEIDIDEIKKVPFQTQVLYDSPKGGKFLRVISSESKTTTDKKESMKSANIGVAHQRVTSLTANLYAKGDHTESVRQNAMWSDYLSNNFQETKYVAKQQAFAEKNRRLNKAIEHKSQKTRGREIEKKEEMPIMEEEEL